MRRPLGITLAVLIACLPACGGSKDEKPRSVTSPAQKAAQADRPAKGDSLGGARPGAADFEGIYRRRRGARRVASIRVEQAGAAIAKYCLEDLGRKSGLRKEAPSQQLTAAKEGGVRTLIQVTRERPGLQLKGGENIQSRLTQAIAILKQGDCDPEAAKQLERTLATYPEP